MGRQCSAHSVYVQQKNRALILVFYFILKNVSNLMAGIVTASVQSFFISEIWRSASKMIRSFTALPYHIFLLESQRANSILVFAVSL